MAGAALFAGRRSGLLLAQCIGAGLQRADLGLGLAHAPAEVVGRLVQQIEARLARGHVDHLQRLAARPGLNLVRSTFTLLGLKHLDLLVQVFSRRRARIPPVDSAGYRHHRGQARCD